MSILNAFSTQEQALERINAYSPSSVPFSRQLESAGADAKWYQGIEKAPGGILSHTWDLAALGSVQLAQESEILRGIDAIAGTDIKGWLEEAKQSRLQKLRESRPDPKTMGVVAQGIQQMGTVVLAGLAGSVAGPAGTIGAIAATTGMDKYWEIRDQTGSHETALKAAKIEGAVMGASAALAPYYGAKLATQAASGVALNVGAGVIERGAIGAVLEADGHHEVAQHYKMLDKEAATIDTILALGFVGLGRYTKAKAVAGKPAIDHRIPHESLDDAMAGNLGIQERTISDRIPTTSAALDYETARQVEFTEQLMDGTPINEIALPPAHPDSIPNPKMEAESQIISKAMDSAMTDLTGKPFAAAIDGARIADEAFRKADAVMREAEAKSVDIVPETKAAEPAAAIDKAAVQEAAKKAADTINPEDITRAISRQTADKMSDVVVRADAEGKNTVTMKQIIEDSDAAYREESIEATLHNVAVQCILGFGGK